MTQLTPGSPRHVGGGVVNMSIAPGAAAVARTLVNVTTPTILAAEDGAVQAGGGLRTSTRPTLNLVLLLPRLYEHSP